MGPPPEAPLPPQTWLQHGSSDSTRHMGPGGCGRTVQQSGWVSLPCEHRAHQAAPEKKVERDGAGARRKVGRAPRSPPEYT